jgi:DNA-binding beta-propeller fold protein YncE
VYRAGPGQDYEVIGVLNDRTVSSFRDTGIAFGATYSYCVAVVTRAGREITSNIEQGSAGVYIEINGQVEAMQVDGQRPYLYALDRVNNSLYFINTQSRQLEKTIFVGSIPTDMDIDAMGGELFIANFGASEIAVVDLQRWLSHRTTRPCTSIRTRAAGSTSFRSATCDRDVWCPAGGSGAANGRPDHIRSGVARDRCGPVPRLSGRL